MCLEIRSKPSNTLPKKKKEKNFLLTFLLTRVEFNVLNKKKHGTQSLSVLHLLFRFRGKMCSLFSQVSIDFVSYKL